MHNTEDIMKRVTRSPADPNNLLEMINTIDQKLEELIAYVDSQGVDLIKLVVYAEAFQMLFMEEQGISKETMQEYLTKANKSIREQWKQNIESNEASDISDIKI